MVTPGYKVSVVWKLATDATGWQSHKTELYQLLSPRFCESLEVNLLNI